MPEHHPLLEGFPAVVSIPVQWGEMDAYGHVNNTVFFRYFETARIAFLELCGFIEAYEELKVGAILHSTSCRFRLPLFFPDTIEVGGRATEIGEDRFVMEYRVVSLEQNGIAAEGTGTIVSFDYGRRAKVPIPPDVMEKLEKLSIR